MSARCDVRCPAAGIVIVRKPGAGAGGGMGELVLCGHHYEHYDVLLSLGGWTVVSDGRVRLAAQEATR